MKSPSDFKGVFIHKEPVDMRKAINGLSAIVEEAGMGELMGPYLFVFCGRRRDVMKVIYFDRSGFAMWQKRLERDKFPWPKKLSDPVVHISTEQFAWLLDGYDVWKMKPFSEVNFERVC
ncbi:MAG: IS66 family insertion sequence element accessory protein TnpB [Bdellovibrionales bacterium]|jgi:transposase